MLNKFQEQDLMGSVEMLEDLKDKISNIDSELNRKHLLTLSEYQKIIKSFDGIIGRLKNINPTLFNYPREAEYTSGKYESTLDWDGEE
tara:strand:+ start:315 stop:578 length:264 start_codon:yes stop_codon:yes gene_type:complete